MWLVRLLYLVIMILINSMLADRQIRHQNTNKMGSQLGDSTLIQECVWLDIWLNILSSQPRGFQCQDF